MTLHALFSLRTAARSPALPGKIAHYLASNGANEQHYHNPGDPYQRCGRGSGPKTVSPALCVTEHFGYPSEH